MKHDIIIGNHSSLRQINQLSQGIKATPCTFWIQQPTLLAETGVVSSLALLVVSAAFRKSWRLVVSACGWERKGRTAGDFDPQKLGYDPYDYLSTYIYIYTLYIYIYSIYIYTYTM